ncbi:MAG: T9SS type A sorting domain-containing protein [Flavobacteriales bacterium]|nr:T9SS type A sorting domain-containing protein [Flavobacteriales bacterium]MCB9365482.1 T9SS type A sorting domain-containing protein [Flavobacteriales bacterium]
MKHFFSFITIFSVSTFMFAQTGPAGVGSSANNVVWLNGDAFTYSSIPNISTWTDQSGNGNDFTQATSSKQPSRTTYSGFNALKFDGADYLRKGAIADLNTNTNTQYIVYNGYKPNHNGIIYDGSFTESDQFFRTYRSSGGKIWSWVLKSSGGTVKNSTTNSSSFQIISSIWDGVAETYNSYKDGSNIGTQVGANGNPTGNYRNTIGAAANNSYRFEGDIGEVIIYNTAVNTAQRNILDNYLSSRYGITISNDLYAYDVTHKYQVIGIGQESDGNNLIAQGAGIVELSASSLDDGDYAIVGHDNTTLSQTTNDIPAAITGGSRLSRTWRVGITNTPGNVDLEFDNSSLTLPTGDYYLLIDSDGDFSNATVVGPVVEVGNLVTFSNVSLSDGDYFTLASGSGTGIVSIASGSWSSTSTWSCSCVPSSNDNVTISAGHTVSATTTTNVNDVTIDGVLNTLSTGNFNVKGDYTISASGNSFHKNVTFNGTSAQLISNASSNTVNIKTLVVSNNNGVSVQNGKFTISNSLSVSDGQFSNAGGQVTLTSTSSKTAVIVNGSGGFSGEFIVQRYISQRNASWGDLSSPVSGNHLRDWDSNPSGTAAELLMCGVNGFSGDCGGWNSVYDYDEGIQEYVAVTDTSFALTPGTGVEIWLDDDGGTLYNKTFDSRGTPNYGDVVVPVNTSWNLIGNPYQAWINYGSITKPSITGAYYIWNTNNGSYDVAFSGSIPPGQAFWVESTGDDNVTFTESSKTGSGSSTFYKTANEEIVVEAKIKVTESYNNYSNELKINLNPKASIYIDDFDATFLPSRIKEAPSITAKSKNSDKPLSIVSFNQENDVVIPISIQSVLIGKHLIEAINFEELKDSYKYILLKDLTTGKSYDLIAESSIEIESNEIESKFELKLSNSNPFANQINSVDNINVYKTNEYVVIDFNERLITSDYQISIVNMLGQKIIEDITNVNTTKIKIPTSKLSKGMNIVSVQSEQGVYVKKINH